MNSSRLQPALLAGVAIGVLSALPVVNVVNLCCCAWVVFGGGLAAYLMQQNQAAPVTAGDGALVGLIAGAFGALVGGLLGIPIAMAMGPFQVQMLERVLEGAREMPPELRTMLEDLRANAAGAAFIGVGLLLWTLTSVIVYSIFGAIGGILGALIFRSNMPPPPPPAGFEPPTFTPPSNFPPPPLPPVST